MDKIILPKGEYETVAQAYRTRNGYDKMSDEEKEAFDEKLDKVLGMRKPAEESGEQKTDMDVLKGEMRAKYGYDSMSDEEKEHFDEKLDKTIGSNDAEGEEDPPDIPEKVLKLSLSR